MENFKNMFKDSSYLKNPEGTWKDGKNLLLTKQFNSPVNENGSKFSHLIEGGYAVGIIETNKHIVYFVKVTNNNNYNSKITVYHIIEETLVDVLKGNFNFNRPIEGIFKYDYQNNLIAAWSDGVFENSNTPKISRITNIDLPLDSDNYLEDDSINLIELFPNTIQGTVEAITGSGNINGIYAYVTFKYGFKNQETVFKDINTYSILSERSKDGGVLLPRGIKAKFRNLDTTFEYIKIGLYIIDEEANKSYISKKINIEESSNMTIDITSLEGYSIISNESLIIPTEKFDKVETITSHKDSILLGKASKKDKFKFQKYANMLLLKPVPAVLPTEETFKLNSQKFLEYSEVYNIHIQLDLNNGDTTEWFHIPNIDFFIGETVDLYDNDYGLEEEYALDLNRFDESLGFKRFHLINNGDDNKFGIWQNENTYPKDNEYNSTIDYDGSFLSGRDLRDTPISFHRVKDKNKEGTVNPATPIESVLIRNFDIIPLEVRKKIKSYRLGFTKRTLGNSLVVSNGMATPVEVLSKYAKNAEANDRGYSNPTDYSYDSNGDLIFDNNIFPEGEDVNINKNLDELTLVFPPRFKVALNAPFHYNNRSSNKLQFFSKDLLENQNRFNFNVTLINSTVFRYINNSSGNNAGITSVGLYYYDLDGYDPNSVAYASNSLTNDIIKKNKYYYGFHSYNYKLPNNSKQGSKYLDGGLFLNYNNNIYNNNNKPESFYPREVEEFNNPEDFGVKTIFTRGLATPFNSLIVHDITLLNIKKNLYDLKSDYIVSSLNTVNVNNSYNSYYSFLKVGDVSLCENNLERLKVPLDEVDRSNLRLSYVPANKGDSLYSTSALSNSELSAKTIDYNTFPVEFNDVDILNVISYGYKDSVSKKFASLNDLGGYPSFDFKDEYIDFFPYRILRSSIAPNESFIISNLRLFSANNYYEMPNNKGDIIALRSNGEFLFIQMRYGLFYAVVKDVIRTEKSDTYLATGDIFDRPPKPITLSKDGYIGSEHKFSCKMYKEGYVTIDHSKGNIIIAQPGVEVISNKSIRNFLSDGLPYLEDEYYENVRGIKQPIDNPYLFIGFSIGYDDKNKRFLFTKLYPQVDGKISNINDYHGKLLGEFNSQSRKVKSSIKINNSKSFTFSYSIDTQNWLFEHDYKPNSYIDTNRGLYALKQAGFNSDSYNMSSVHKLYEGNKGEFFGVKYESYIDVIFNQKKEISKDYQALEILTEVHNEVNAVNPNKTIDKIVVYNHHQCSGEIVLDLENYDIIRSVEGVWKVNNFRDIVIDSSFPIKKKDGSINIDNLDFSKNWFDKSYFISKFLVIRCIWSNDTNEDVYLNAVNSIAKISKR